jgi:hypothetical protein
MTVRVIAGQVLEYFSVYHSTTIECIILLRTAEYFVHGEIKTHWTPTTNRIHSTGKSRILSATNSHNHQDSKIYISRYSTVTETRRIAGVDSSN